RSSPHLVIQSCRSLGGTAQAQCPREDPIDVNLPPASWVSASTRWGVDPLGSDDRCHEFDMLSSVVHAHPAQEAWFQEHLARSGAGIRTIVHGSAGEAHAVADH